MRLLLDTHAFLWWISDDTKMGPHARSAIESSGNEVLVSAVSGWEIAIKAGLGRLGLPGPPAAFVTDQILKNDFGALPVSLVHGLEVFSLPEHHRDPFDRLLISQGRVERIPIISGDAAFRDYDVEVVW